MSFLDPAFNRLDPSELKALHKSNQHDYALIRYFEAEALFLRRKVQASQEILESLKKTCAGSFSKTQSKRIEVLCFLGELGFSVESERLAFHLKKERIQKTLEALKSNQFSFEERAYLEGRLLWRIPAELGGSSSRSLLGWESLRRLRPELSCADFFISQIYEKEGKRKLSEDAFERALNHSPPDPRAQLVRTPVGIPVKGRFYFGVLGYPAGGAGITIGRRDEHFLDTDRELDVSISAQTRGVYLGRCSYEDRVSLEPTWIMGRLLAASEIDQFFGLGSESRLTSLTEISQARSQGSIGFRRWFSNFYLEAALGWFLREPSSVTGSESSNPEVRARQQSLMPMFEVGFKEKNKYAAFLQVSGAKQDLASSHSFQVYRLGLQRVMGLGDESVLDLKTQIRGMTGQNPFGMLSQLSGNMPVPGVRMGRFRGNWAWYATAEWQTPIWEEFSGAVFGNIASLGSSFSDFSKGTLLTGGGGALVVGRRSFQTRLEIGHFSGETVIQTGVQFFSE